MTTSIFIPKKIKVGFQNRSDTYTNKLAYVVYYDEKGNLKKETSWENWRDKSIEPKDFPNDPIEGFMLNKKVGGYRYYDYRQTYIRVLDPRGFEFEINVQNLLYILENQSCGKGKVLEGKYVYGWNGKDLILVPIEAPEYTEITETSKKILSGESILPSQLLLGRTYKDKKNKLFIFLGRYDLFEYDHKYFSDRCEMERFLSAHSDYRCSKEITSFYVTKPLNKGKYFWFIDIEAKSIVSYKSVSKRFYELVDSNVHRGMDYFLDTLKHQENFSPVSMDKSYCYEYSFEEAREKFRNIGKWDRSTVVRDGKLCESRITNNGDGSYTLSVWVNGSWMSKAEFETTDSFENIYKVAHFGHFVPVLENGNFKEYYWNRLKDYEF